MTEKVLELEYLDKETRELIRIVPSNFRRYMMTWIIIF